MNNENQQAAPDDWAAVQPKLMRFTDKVNELLGQSYELNGRSVEFDTWAFDEEVGWERGETHHYLAGGCTRGHLRFHPTLFAEETRVVHIGIPLAPLGQAVWDKLARHRLRNQGRPFVLNLAPAARELQLDQAAMQECINDLVHMGIVDCIPGIKPGSVTVTLVQLTEYEYLDQACGKPDGSAERFFNEMAPVMARKDFDENPELRAAFGEVVKRARVRAVQLGIPVPSEEPEVLAALWSSLVSETSRLRLALETSAGAGSGAKGQRKR